MKAMPSKDEGVFITRAYDTRYKNVAPITTQKLPAGWKAKCTIVKGMFMTNSAPLGSHRKFGEYADQMLHHSHFSNGTSMLIYKAHK